MRLQYAINPLKSSKKTARPFFIKPILKKCSFLRKGKCLSLFIHRPSPCELDPEVLDLYSSWVSAVLCCVRCSHALLVCDTKTHIPMQGDRIAMVFGSQRTLRHSNNRVTENQTFIRVPVKLLEASTQLFNSCLFYRGRKKANMWL